MEPFGSVTVCVATVLKDGKTGFFRLSGDANLLRLGIQSVYLVDDGQEIRWEFRSGYRK